jgi:hypothetical protein
MKWIGLVGYVSAALGPAVTKLTPHAAQSAKIGESNARFMNMGNLPVLGRARRIARQPRRRKSDCMVRRLLI